MLVRDKEKVHELLRQIGSFYPKEGQRDAWVWTKDSSGSYTVSSAYDGIQEDFTDDGNGVFCKLWAVKAPPSNQLAFAWRVLIDRVQTKVDLSRRNALPASVSTLCAICSISNESRSFAHSYFAPFL